MIRGTTPSLFFNLPFESTEIQSAEITLEYVDANKKVLIVKTLEDCELGEKSIGARLTQEETLQIPAPSKVYVQLRILNTDNVALATVPIEVTVRRLLTEGVIE